MGSKTTIEINGHHYDARTGKRLHEGIDKPAKSTNTTVDVTRNQATSHHMHQKPQRSQTLMRHAVKKPVVPTINKPTAANAIADFVSPVTTNLNTLFPNKVDTARLTRATKVKQSHLVSRFQNASSILNKPIAPKVQPLAVQSAPSYVSPLLHHSAHPKTDALIARGLKNAQSHKESHKVKQSRTRRHGKFISLAASSAAFLLLAGFFAFQNIPNMAMRYAVARSGVEAHLPGYKPTGFALSKRIHYSPGQITLNFTSNSDERSFKITQRETDWDSDTLRNNYVASVDSQVHNYIDNDRTIYLYGDSNATWINDGVWYEIDGDSQLNSDQLIRIATSL